MRKIHERLQNRFVFLSAHFVEHHRHEHGRGKTEEYLQKTDDECISQHLSKFHRFEKLGEMHEAHPGTAHDPLFDVIVFKCQRHPVHRIVTKNYVKRGDGQKQEI